MWCHVMATSSSCRRPVMFKMWCSCSCNNTPTRRWLAWNRHGPTKPTHQLVHAHVSSSDLWMSTLLMSHTSSRVIFRQRFHKRRLPVRLLCLANTVIHPPVMCGLLQSGHRGRISFRTWVTLPMKLTCRLCTEKLREKCRSKANYVVWHVELISRYFTKTTTDLPAHARSRNAPCDCLGCCLFGYGRSHSFTSWT